MDVALSASVDVGEGAKSLRSLKQEFKDAQKELDGLTVGSEKYVASLQKLGKIKDDIGDLNDEIKAFNPEGKVKAFSTVIGGVASGFQAATGAAALFGGQNEELQKTLIKVQAAMAFAEGIKGLVSLGDAFKVLGNVIKANPIFLIVGLVLAIGTALFELKDKIPLVGKAFEILGDVIKAVVQYGKDILDFLGLTDFKMQGLAESIIKNSERIKTATSDRYDSEIAAAKRAGKETELLEIAKLNAITKTNDAVIAQLRLRAQTEGTLSEEDKKTLDERVAQNKKAYQDILNLSDQYKDHQVENQKKITQTSEEEHAKQFASRKKLNDDAAAMEAATNQAKAEFDAANKLAADEQETNDLLAADEAMQAQTQKYIEEKDKRDARAKQSSDDERGRISASLQLAQASNNSMMALSDLYFMAKNRNLQKGSAEELKSAKKQFQINKALAIQSAIISGIQGVVNALSAQSVVPEPFGTILKVATAVGIGIAAAVNVAKIASTKFDPGGSGGTISADVGSVASSAPSISAPTVNAPNNSTTQLNPDGTVKQNDPDRAPAIKATVVETDVTNSQRRVGSIETNAKI